MTNFSIADLRPELFEDTRNGFRLTLPLTILSGKNEGISVETESPVPKATGEVRGEVRGEVTGEVRRLLEILGDNALGRVEAQAKLKLRSQANFRDRYLIPALDAALIKRTVPEKPNSPLQKYRLTAKGRKAIMGDEL